MNSKWYRKMQNKLIKYVYVSGPFTSDPTTNTHKAIKMADQLSALGLFPFIPHLMLLWDAVSPRSYEEWMNYDIAWLERCDAIIRIPGESSGSDREVAHASRLGIPIFFNISDLWSSQQEYLQKSSVLDSKHT